MSVAMNFMNLAIFQFYFCPDFKCSRGGGLIGRCKNFRKKREKRGKVFLTN